MSLKANAAAGIRWTSLSSVVATGSEMLRTVILARFLSPADFGLMAMVTLVIGFAQMYTDLGISAAIIHRQHTTREALSSLYWLNLFAGLGVCVVVLLCSPLISIFFSELRLVPLLKVVALVFVVASLGSQFEILLQKELAFGVLARTDILASVGNTVVAVVGAVYGFGVWALVWGFVTNIILRTFLLVRAGWTRFHPLWHFDRSDVKGYINFGLFQIGERTLNYSGQRLDQILVGSVLGTQALGFYSFAINLTSQPMYRINPIVNRVAFPLFSKFQDDRERLKNGYTKLLSFLATVNAPLLIGLAVVAPLAIPLIFGAKWSKSVILLQILCFVTLFRTTGNPVGNLLLAKGRADLGFKWTSFFIVLSVPAVYSGGRIGGSTGIATALLILQAILLFPGYFYLVRPLVGKCGREYSSAILKPITLAAGMGLVVGFLPLLLKGFPGLFVLASQLTVGSSLYLVLLWFFYREFLLEFRDLFFARAKGLDVAT